MKEPGKPPIYTVLVELTGWTLGRTTDLPKAHRFTFGQRLDNQTLDVLTLTVRAIYSATEDKKELLSEINLQLEVLRVLWRLVHERRWISAQQLLHVSGRLDEAGRMAGGWLKSLRNPVRQAKPPPLRDQVGGVGPP